MAPTNVIPSKQPIDIGVVTGVARERAIAERLVREAAPQNLNVHVVCAGASHERAGALAEMLCSHGAKALLSFGVAGGLDPSLRPGDLLLASAVVAPHEQTLTCDAAWRRNVLAAAMAAGGPSLTVAKLAASRQPVADLAAKRDLRLRSEAAAVDMESLAVARAAEQADLPFIVLRAVADGADSALPGAVAQAIGPEGQTRPWPVLLGLLRRPSETLPLLKLARQSEAAFHSLQSLAKLAPALFGGFREKRPDV